MALTRPTLQQLIDQAHTQIDALLPGADSRLRRSFLDVLARVLAWGLYGLYSLIVWVSQQVFPDTAEQEFLDRWATIWGLARLASTFSAGTVDLTGQDGSEIPAGTALRRASGEEYTTDVLATIAAGVASVAVSAAKAGAASDAAAGTTLSFVSPVPGVDSTATVAAGGLTGGADEESDDALRARLLERLRQPPHGGAELDYIRWAKEIAGVTRVWVFAQKFGEGTVGVTFVRDDESPIIPDAAELQTVQDYIDDPARRPVPAKVTVYGLTAVAQNFDIRVLPDTTAVRAAAQGELEDLLEREATPGGTIKASRISEAISKAAGETSHTIIAPAGDITVATDEIAVPGTFTWE